MFHLSVHLQHNKENDMRSQQHLWRLGVITVLIIAALALAACPAPVTAPAEQPAATPVAAEEPAAVPEGEAETPTIAFSGFSSTNEFWLTLARAAEARAQELGVNFVNVTTPNPDAQAQVAAVENAITQGVDAIIVGATDSRAFGDAFDKAQAAGIPIITVDTGVDHPWVKTLMQTDNEAAAKMAGEYLVEKAGPDCKKLLIIGGIAGHQTGDARKNGVEAAAKAAGYEVIVEYADWLEPNAADIAQNQLTANPDLCAIFVAWDPGAVAALSVIKQKGLTDQITLVGFDALPAALKAIKAGEMTATVRQDPDRMGTEGIDLALKVINGEEVPKFTPIDGAIVDASNVDEFLTE
jgi:ribose transport system substrate-binding protein